MPALDVGGHSSDSRDSPDLLCQLVCKILRAFPIHRHEEIIPIGDKVYIPDSGNVVEPLEELALMPRLDLY